MASARSQARSNLPRQDAEALAEEDAAKSAEAAAAKAPARNEVAEDAGEPLFEHERQRRVRELAGQPDGDAGHDDRREDRHGGDERQRPQRPRGVLHPVESGREPGLTAGRN